MNRKYILKYITSLFLFFTFTQIHAQQDSTVVKAVKKIAKVSDSIEYKDKYGLRLGIDISKPALSFAKSNYTGLEITGDFRLSKNLYIAAEIGNENKTTTEDYYTYNSKGSYLKGGIDYNVYDNWYGMQNIISIGARLGITSFKQDLQNYTLYNANPYWNEDVNGDINDILGEKSGLSAQWLEFVISMKVEVLNNVYMGPAINLKFLMNNTSAANFPNLWMPGFNTVTEGSKFGVGFNYTISYLIPIFKKTHKVSIKPK
ncbi:DUF6048 family protein [Zhouia sp. PK063]|uniref:DUF6048 family protein n=1 Tax=Zhouia sp. PK063 TaxID=3373602 RepID=UPI0037AF64AC